MSRIKTIAEGEVRDEMSKITVTVTGRTGSGKSAIVGEIEIALKAIGVPVTVSERDTMVVADYQYWIDLYKPEVTIVEQNIGEGMT
jgi:Ni2+-binding GTPase involved in maturation of urease and hydrogenase